MATRPLENNELSHSPVPSSPPERSSKPSTSHSINPSQLPFTPPPSLPTTAPGSPEHNNKLLTPKQQTDKLNRSSPIASTSSSRMKVNGSTTSPSSSKKKGKMNLAFTNHVEVSEMPEGYGDHDSKPILPKTRIPFSSVFSDDSADGFGSPEKSKRRGSSTKREGRRIVSQETTTTTTTRKLERRKIRYSASILDEMSDSNLPQPIESIKSSKSQPILTHRSHSPNHASTSRSHSHSSSRPKHRSTASPRRPTSTLYPTSPPQSSPASPRISSHSRRPKSSSVSRPSRLSTKELVLHSNSDSPTSPFDDPSAFANALGDTTLPLFRPFVNMFTFLLVSSFCCMTVSAVLFASFSLTFYDDCGRRLSGLNRSLRAGARSIEGGIGGVREGMGKMLGNARGAIDSAVKAAEGITTNGDEDIGQRGTHQSKRTAMPTVTEEDNEGDDEGENDEDEEQMGSSQRDKGKSTPRSRSRNRSPGGAGAPRTQGWRFRPSPGPSSLRRSFNPFSSFSAPPSPVDPTPLSPSEPLPSASSEHKSGWATDEDALPYEVPHPTPYTSRPASPHRSPRSRQSSSSSNTSSSPPLPPRPHLAVLLPSLFFAVFLTLAKLAYSFWKANKERREELRKRQERFEEEWNRKRREESWRNQYTSTSSQTSYHN